MFPASCISKSVSFNKETPNSPQNTIILFYGDTPKGAPNRHRIKIIIITTIINIIIFIIATKSSMRPSIPRNRNPQISRAMENKKGLQSQTLQQVLKPQALKTSNYYIVLYYILLYYILLYYILLYYILLYYTQCSTDLFRKRADAQLKHGGATVLKDGHAATGV